MPISSSQFGDADSFKPSTPDLTPPMSYSSGTSNSAAQATAWKTRDMSGGRPLAWSKKTGGTTFKFDDDATPNLPSSDKGAGRN